MRAVVRRRLAGLGSAVLTAGAVLGAVCLLTTLVAPLVGIRPLIFLSGSMSPTIPAGSLALARTVDAEAIEVNDIVTVRSNGTYLTHRVLEVTHAPGRATLLLRGDGNEVPDATVYEVASAPRTEIWVPHAGAVVAWFSHAPGVYVLAGWVAVVIGTLRRRGAPPGSTPGSTRGPTPPAPPVGRPRLLLVTGRALGRTPSSRRSPQPHGGRAAGVAAVATLVLAVPSPALAAWGDLVQVTGTSIATVTPTTPAAWCTDLGSTVRISWSAQTAATGYLISYGGLGADRVVDEPVASTVTHKDFGSSQEGRFEVAARFGSTTWVSDRSPQVNYTKGNCG